MASNVYTQKILGQATSEQGPGASGIERILTAPGAHRFLRPRISPPHRAYIASFSQVAIICPAAVRAGCRITD